MGTDAEAQQFYNSRVKIFAALIPAMLFLTMFPTLILWKVILSEGSKHWLYVAATVVGTYFLALLTIRMFNRKLKDRAPQLSISSSGVFDPTISQEIIPWEVVKDVSYMRYGRGPNGVQLKVIVEKARKLKLSKYWERNLPYFGYVQISPIFLNASAYRIFIIIRDAFNQSKALHN